MMRTRLLVSLTLVWALPIVTSAQDATLLRPDRVFDGRSMHEGWVVLVEGGRITAAGPAASVGLPATALIVDLTGMTVMPTIIDTHVHTNIERDAIIDPPPSKKMGHPPVNYSRMRRTAFFFLPLFSVAAGRPRTSRSESRMNLQDRTASLAIALSALLPG